MKLQEREEGRDCSMGRILERDKNFYFIIFGGVKTVKGRDCFCCALQHTICELVILLIVQGVGVLRLIRYIIGLNSEIFTNYYNFT